MGHGHCAHASHITYFVFSCADTPTPPGSPARGKRNKLLDIEYATAVPGPGHPGLQGLLKPMQLQYAGSAEITAVTIIFCGLNQGSRTARMPHPNGGLDLLERYRFFAPALARVAEFEEAVEHPVVAGGDEAHTTSSLTLMIY